MCGVAVIVAWEEQAVVAVAGRNDELAGLVGEHFACRFDDCCTAGIGFDIWCVAGQETIFFFW